jgi:hypothetical protein
LRDENTNLHEECSELRSKVSSLQKIITRAGRRQEPLLDPGIVTDFTRLNSGIFQFVRNHLAATLPGPGIAPGITDLYIQSQVATALHSKFFSRDAILFGYSDHKPYSVFSGFEKDLKSHECDGDSSL